MSKFHDRKRKLPPLKALQAFEACARLGSFTKAAKELSVTQTAISHQVRSLETFFALTLFDRSRREVTVSTEGLALQQFCTEWMDRLDKLSHELLEPAAGQAPLRITLPPVLGSRWLAPRLGDYWSNHKVELNLIPSTELLDFRRDDIDLGIRCGAGDWPGLEAEFLMSMSLTPVCSQSLLTERPGLRTPDDLGQYTLLHEINYEAWGEWLAAKDHHDTEYRRGVICQDSSMLYDLTLRGQGIALGSVTVLVDELKTGMLVMPFGEPDGSAEGYYLVYRKSSIDDHRVRTFRDFVIEQAAAGRTQ